MLKFTALVALLVGSLAVSCTESYSGFSRVNPSNSKNKASSTTDASSTSTSTADASGDKSTAGTTGSTVVAPAQVNNNNVAANPVDKAVKAILLDWPNVIECRGTGAGTQYRQYFYLSHVRSGSKVVFVDPYNHNAVGAGAYALVFNMDKSSAGTNGGSTESMADCVGKSIAELGKMGRLHPAEKGKNIFSDWPDAIECKGAAESQFVYLSHFGDGSSPTYADPYTHKGTGPGAYGLVFNSDKTSKGTLGGSQESMADCVGKSIGELQNMGRGKLLFTGNSIFGEWPTAIECRGVGANSGARQIFYLSHTQNSGSSVAFVDPYTHNGTGAGAYGLVFDSERKFESTLGGSTASMDDCIGKSISELTNMGRVHF